jgi:hypothetical protein
LFPEQIEGVTEMADSLPFHEQPLGYPFTGLVVNVNVTTLAHQDDSDACSICMVVQWGDAEGGAVCLYECGLVLELSAGDAVPFLSEEITHFNTDFTGDRLSMVYHTDKEMRVWTENYNHLGNSIR